MSADPCAGFTGTETYALCVQMIASDTQIAVDLNSFFLLWGGALVLFMHAGFAMLSAGAIRAKNAKNILISITMDLTVCAIAWYLLGYGFAFGSDYNGFVGSSFWVGIDVGSSPAGTASFHFWFFQWAFAATSATIVSGAIAERARFDTYLLYSFFISIWVYPIVVHWVWGGGWLTLGNSKALMSSGVVDFAGCGPVHMVGGLAGAIGAKIMGPRIGRFDPESGKAIPIPGHSTPLATLGTFILWVGWIGFNSGSVLLLTPGGGTFAARAAVNSILSSSTAALSALLYSHFRSPERDYDVGMALNGALAGLVSITGCACYVEMWAAIAIGFIGGLIYVGSSRFTLNVLKIDDPLDATPVHLFCGMWGIVAGAWFTVPYLISGFFPSTLSDDGLTTYKNVPAGIFYGGNSVLMFSNGTQLPGPTRGPLVANAVVEIVVIFTWVAGFMTPFFFMLQKAGILRVAADIESQGLDVSHHGGGAYPDLFHAMDAAESKRSTHGKPAAAAAPPAAAPPAAEPAAAAPPAQATPTDVTTQ